MSFLTTTDTRVNDGYTLLYRARLPDCAICPLKTHCCPKAPLRKIPRNIYEDARDVARVLSTTAGYEQSRRDRKRVEMLFAHLKCLLRAQPPAIARAVRRPVRVHTHGHCPEPSQTRQADCSTATSRVRRVRCVGVHLEFVAWIASVTVRRLPLPPDELIFWTYSICISLAHDPPFENDPRYSPVPKTKVAIG